MASWDDLKKREREPVEPDEYALLCVQALDTPAGRQLMAYLHGRYINAVLSGTPDERALANLNAKRQVVRELEEQTARGLAALGASKDKTA